MKKLVVTLIATGMLVGLGAAFAQGSQQHQVTVNIPNLLMIRITDGGTNAASNPSVTFDYSTTVGHQEAYMTAIGPVGGANLPPTDVSAFGDVLVFSSSTALWSLYVRASGMVPGFDLSDIVVTPGAVSTFTNLSTAIPAATWSLSTSWQTIYTAGTRTIGWKSLGFNGNDYAIHVDGTETPGNYSTIVTYSFTNP